MKVKLDLKRRYRRFLDLLRGQKPRNLAIAGLALLVTYLWAVSKIMERETRVYESKSGTSFEGSRILGSSKEVYERQGMLLENRVKNIEKSQREIKDSIEALAKRTELEAMQPPATAAPNSPQSDEEATTGTQEGRQNAESLLETKPQSFLPPSSNLQTEQVLPNSSSSNVVSNGGRVGSGRAYQGGIKNSGGPAIISFPVDAKSQPTEMGVVLPVGSFVRGKILSGVEAPEGKALPVLLQADYAFVGPNKTRIDLSGCFLIAKSTGNLSIERVEMQATKLSCVSRSGQMFERDINGYVADEKDNSFAVMGSVNTKQDRVATMAFVSSVVEGIGKAVAQAQTSTQTNEAGASRTIIDGDQGKYIAAGGASNAATMVTDWYLKQAQNLLPTINVGSGQDVWIVMQESVSLPNSYFKNNQQNRSDGNVYSYLSRVMD
ncbi:MAG: TraB/VirB10 family protein [Oligoflexales bacterium]